MVHAAVQGFNVAGQPSPAALGALDSYKKKDATKGPRSRVTYPALAHSTAAAVYVLFKAVGGAPVMKKNKFQIGASNPFQAIIRFLRKEIDWKPADPLVRVRRSCSTLE